MNPPEWLSDPKKREAAALSAAQAVQALAHYRARVAKPVPVKVPLGAGTFLTRSQPPEKEDEE